MHKLSLAMAAATLATALVSQAASAQDSGPVSDVSTSFRGFRVEGDIGGDRFQSQGHHDNKFGYGATVGFDGQIGDKIVVGPEASYWRANNWSENCTAGNIGGSICHKSFEEYGAAVRAGYLVTPQLLVFAKGGYVSNEQRKAFAAPAGETSFYNHGRTDGYQVGGGVEYSLTQVSLPLPVYVSAQYVYSNYDDHTARQRAMLGVGVHFK
ncbi:porin family protein [uncultured Sphingomonas sp.]|uniref:outer membrane protein n=1 Tax=uncultured Sphingomonas sp. TaxID=158754 RepID=UPI0026139E9D|nr:porin family protein [uncultured Sphingomonas sp.]